MNTIQAELTQLQHQAERMRNDEAKRHATFEVGDVAAQGDVLIVAIAGLPKSAKPRASRQIADGDTQGSRHVVERGRVFDADPDEIMWAIDSATSVRVGRNYIGPIFTGAGHDRTSFLTHPEHGDQEFPAGTVCATVFQRTLDAEEREQRVMD